MGQISKVYIPSDEEFRQIVANAYSYSDCLRAVGLGTNGGSSTDTLKRRIQELNCDISHFNRGISQQGISPNTKYTLEEIMVENSSYTNIKVLKKRLVNEGIFEYKCAICGNKGEWNGKPLSLQLDHIDGNNRNHTKENLRFLCPNCHSQTETFAGKNIVDKKEEKQNYCIDCGTPISNEATRCRYCEAKTRIVPLENMPITREELKQLIRTTPFTTIGAMYGVADNSIRKWCDKFNLPKKVSEIKQYSDEEWTLI